MAGPRVPVLITRAEPGASESAMRVKALGAEAILAPMLTLVPDPATALPDLESVSDLVFTSANGVRVFADRSPVRDRIAWCVGPATAAAAEATGFEHVKESAGNAVDLAAFIAAGSEPGEKPLLHIANAAAKGDLKTHLNRLGFSVRFAPLYAMQAAEGLPVEARTCLESKATIVLIHSAKGAERFAQLCSTIPTSRLHLVAISSPAASALSVLNFASTHIATAPNEDGLMNALSAAIATLSA